MTEDGENVLQEYGKIATGGIDYQSYFDIKTCMQKYVDNINIKNSKYFLYDKTNHKLIPTDENEIKENIYGLLSDRFIKENDITIENLYDNVETIEKAATYLPIEAGLIQDGDIKSFVVYGLVQSTEDYSVICKLFSIVNINIVEGKFSIEPLYGNYNSISDISIKNTDEAISENKINKFAMTQITAENYPAEYVNIYKCLALGDPERLYNLLDEQYRNARFGNIEEFKNYIQKNKEKIQGIRLDKYKVDSGENSVRYICLDQNQNYYVINQKEILQDYTIMLDTYTIDLPEFIDKYEKSNNKLKVALNIEKLVEATKMGDYKYVYNRINESFKTNKFNTVTDFEKFINERFNPKEDTIKYVRHDVVTGVNVFDIEVTDTSANKVIKAEIIMELKDNREFEFSFSVEE